MKSVNGYIYLLLFCIFLQNDNTGFVDLLKSMVDSKDHLSVFLKNAGNAPAEEESEDNEKESKENENKENENKENENKEKEKEFKNVKYLHSFIFLPAVEVVDSFLRSEDSKLFSLDSDIDTPPPKIIIEA